MTPLCLWMNVFVCLGMLIANVFSTVQASSCADTGCPHKPFIYQSIALIVVACIGAIGLLANLCILDKFLAGGKKKCKIKPSGWNMSQQVIFLRRLIPLRNTFAPITLLWSILNLTVFGAVGRTLIGAVQNNQSCEPNRFDWMARSECITSTVNWVVRWLKTRLCWNLIHYQTIKTINKISKKLNYP